MNSIKDQYQLARLILIRIIKARALAKQKYHMYLTLRVHGFT